MICLSSSFVKFTAVELKDKNFLGFYFFYCCYYYYYYYYNVAECVVGINVLYNSAKVKHAKGVKVLEDKFDYHPAFRSANYSRHGRRE